ncbi:2-oxo-4-hydroxy-4-carboxy-5-ureidoimidazoline decarboxylase [Paeniglutamicibacter sp. NPDC012692]|uniref:2-oxo-4-hydroxy-4-carboxy-5-ureidoimidazoline decarboxylase n=1 Tax=Paeniglutamicibacter sp. NPDC012692 TaxID=3364388 RepID=UPI00368930D8
MDLLHFNTLDTPAAASVLRPCLDVDRWIDSIVDSRPFGSIEDLVAQAGLAASSLSEEEIASALAHHPRIGERAEGGSTEATLSREEQSALALDDGIKKSLSAGNRAYEQRFDRVFLIRAAGRSSEEILAELDRRLSNADEEETREVGQQLREIALLRLDALFESVSAS